MRHSWSEKRPELLAPAGGFAAGYYALEAGADAVYLGLDSFSARGFARNFTLDELARFKALAESRGRRVYVALNTVIRQTEMPILDAVLRELEALAVDGVIVQDLGLLNLMRRAYPSVSIHASTQMAVHNSAGIEGLKRLGVRRFILARELTLPEIERLRAAHPDVELEVFVHGAQCFGFSGLCLASGLLLGRSGNRGECAQPCRGWYSCVQAGSARPALKNGQRAYYFSSTDLCAADLIRRLAEIGVDSFKIEGRMKPPGWVRAATSCYRAVLDSRTRDVPGLLQEAAVIFARTSGTGFLLDAHGPPCGATDVLHPGQRGVPAGVVVERRAGEFSLRLRVQLAVRDGLMYLRDGNPPRAVPFAVREMRYESDARSIFDAPAGRTVVLSADEPPPPGKTVYKISSHAAALREPNPSAFPPKKKPLRVVLSVHPGGLAMSPSAEHGPRPPGSGAHMRPPEAPESAPGADDGPPALAEVACRVEAARGRRSLLSLARQYLDAPADSRFNAEFHIANSSGLPDDGVFVNPSALKELRRRFWSAVEAQATAGGADSPFPPRALCREPAHPLWRAAREAVLEDPPPRARLVFPSSGLPFFTGEEDLSEAPALAGGRLRLVPLFPVLFDVDAYRADLERAILAYQSERAEDALVLGLGNVGHIGLAAELAQWGERNGYAGRLYTFIDYGLHLANGEAAALLAGLEPRPLFAYPWIEEAEEGPAPGRYPDLLLAPYGAFEPPLFISRACVARGALVSRTEGGDQGPANAQRLCAGCPAAGGGVPPAPDEPRFLDDRFGFAVRRVRVTGACLNLVFRDRDLRHAGPVALRPV